MPGTYTVFMTRGAYVVDESAADAILHAISRGLPHVGIHADILGDGLCTHPMRIITAHVVSISANAGVQAVEPADDAYPGRSLALVRGGLT
jgi:hypothetical protein